MHDELIEKVARAVCQHDDLDPDELVDSIGNGKLKPRWSTREFAGRQSAALAAMREAMVPVAFYKQWWVDGLPKCRVDMSEICEPWLDDLKPEITPLYSLPGERG